MKRPTDCFLKSLDIKVLIRRALAMQPTDYFSTNSLRFGTNEDLGERQAIEVW
jgi:hypothetical protein